MGGSPADAPRSRAHTVLYRELRLADVHIPARLLCGRAETARFLSARGPRKMACAVCCVSSPFARWICEETKTDDNHDEAASVSAAICAEAVEPFIAATFASPSVRRAPFIRSRTDGPCGGEPCGEQASCDGVCVGQRPLRSDRRLGLALRCSMLVDSLSRRCA